MGDPREAALQEQIFELSHNWLLADEMTRIFDAIDAVDPLRQHAAYLPVHFGEHGTPLPDETYYVKVDKRGSEEIGVGPDEAAENEYRGLQADYAREDS